MFLRYNLFNILWALFILVVSLSPGEAMPLTDIWQIISFDKIAHFAVYAILSFLCIVGFTKQYNFRWLRKNAVVTAIGFSIIYGVILELLQSFSPGRFIEYADIFANSIGCALGYVIYLVIYKVN